MKLGGTWRIRNRWHDLDWWLTMDWHGRWVKEASASEFTHQEVMKFTLPAGGEWVYEHLTLHGDNNEEEMDVPHRRDGSNDHPVTD